MGLAGTIDDTFGMLYIAVAVSSALYGAGVLQFWMYIRKYHKKDPLLVKGVVIAVQILDTVQQALVCESGTSSPRLHENMLTPSQVYRYLVSSMRDPTILASVVKTLMIELFFSCAIATLVQQFYCWRIYRIGKSIILALAVSAVSWTSCVVLLIYAAKAVSTDLLSDIIKLKNLSIAANTLSAAADITISVALVLLLHVAKTGFKRSTDLINRLMIFSFNTGLPTSICALVATVCVAAFSNTFLYIFFFLLLGRLYTNSILVTLNSREYIKSSSDHHNSGEQYSLENNTGRPRMPTIPASNHDPITIRIETNTMQDYHSTSMGDLKN
ncbi:unnamed protein product [Mycena citricolor]|uniref:DUF6534 domain-containing protein n=1 Tax=Mycena citricolor TaxID=2018698 RepID=A0AAD2HVM0_9AGAR|nr:unnamed protein product [Mycena citricolor]